MDPSGLLTFIQLCDSALPIGTAAHSFGLETLVAEERVTVDELPAFLHDLVSEAGALEGAFCREAHQLAAKCAGASRGPLPADPASFAPDWIDVSDPTLTGVGMTPLRAVLPGRGVDLRDPKRPRAAGLQGGPAQNPETLGRNVVC
jgi:hypothetical protein